MKKSGEHGGVTEGQRRLAAIMFTDIAGYSALSQKNEATEVVKVEIAEGVLP